MTDKSILDKWNYFWETKIKAKWQGWVSGWMIKQYGETVAKLKKARKLKKRHWYNRAIDVGNTTLEGLFSKTTQEKKMSRLYKFFLKGIPFQSESHLEDKLLGINKKQEAQDQMDRGGFRR